MSDEVMPKKIDIPDAVRAKAMTMALHYAAENGRMTWVHDLIAAGAALEARNEYGQTALMLAAERNHANIVRALLQAGVDKDARDSDGKTALMLAAGSEHTGSMQALLEAGADKDVADNDGNTAMHLASYYPDAIRILAAAGANLEARNNNGKTPLIRAAYYHRHGGAVCELIAAGAALDAQDDEGNTALIWAAGNGDIDNVSALLAAGADANIQNNSGETALEKAQNGEDKDEGRQEEVSLLLQTGSRKDGAADVMRWLRWMAMDKNENAMLELGKIYLSGSFQEKDVDKAIMYFQKAADGGSHEARIILGGMYRDGNGVKQNGKKAISLFLEAVNMYKDNGEAQAALGEMYRLGIGGVKKDMAKALRWHGKAARQFRRYDGSGKHSRKILQGLAGQGIAEAAFLMGEAYRRGWGDSDAVPSCKEAEKTAVQWYLRAIALGHAEAAEALEHIKNTVRDRLSPHEAEALKNGDISLEELLKRRNRTRAVIGDGLSLDELEQLLESQNTTGRE